jgi:hypothetical protein
MMWKDDRGRLIVSGLRDPVAVMSETFRRSLDLLVDQDSGTVARALREAEARCVEAEAAFVADPLVEAKFRGVKPPGPLLTEQIASADELRELILQVDRRWQMDVITALDDYLE